MIRKYYPEGIFCILVIVTLGIITTEANANQGRLENLSDEASIKNVIWNYFDRRYSSRATCNSVDIREFIDDSPEAYSFIQSETEKLEVELYNAQLNHLGYARYNYTLDFQNISIDIENQIATVFLTEGHDVVFDISEMISNSEVIVSRLRNLQHTINLRNIQGEWRITSDYYSDYLWRYIRASNLPTAELIRVMDELQGRMIDISSVSDITSFCNLSSDASTHPYYRTGAVNYAHRYAYDSNPEYYYFPLPYGDCTNFVNQAIHVGSYAEEVGSNTYGWYYHYYDNYQSNDYSASWTDVQSLYDFITQYYVWDKGPEGCLINNDYSALEGDLVQFEWNDDGDTSWDHSVIIVKKVTCPDDPYNPYYYVAGHSDDVDNYPLSSFIFQSRRFIRIERIDGFIHLYVPFVYRHISGYSPYNIGNPYPVPLTEIDAQMLGNPYPAP